VHRTLQPHDNGIFDLKWNMSDTLLATVSGDRLGRISDLETNCIVQTLRGHQGTVKCVSWDPCHRDVLATGARDGMIYIWDLRVGEAAARQEQSGLCPVMTISSAHEDAGANGKRKAPKGRHASIPKSITGLIYSDANPYHLISSGSSDGCVLFNPPVSLAI
jgi:denticleless